jgi:hypothetical protein
MQEIELRFRSLADLMHFKQQSQVKELRIDTAEKSLTGRFPETEVKEAVTTLKATIFSNQRHSQPPIPETTLLA